MKKYLFLLLIVVFVSAFWGNIVMADSREEQIEQLQRKIAELEEQAHEYENSIANKQSEVNSLKKEISLLNSNISNIQNSIDITTAKIQSTELEILLAREQIFDMTDNISNNQKLMASLMSQMYENDKTNVVVLLLRSKKISDFANEAQKIETVNNSLKILVEELKQNKAELEGKRDSLVTLRTDLEGLNEENLQQKNSLGYTKSRKNDLLVTTKGEEAEYQKLLSETEQKKAEFFAELQRIESDALQKGSFLTKVTAQSVPAPGTVLFEYPYNKYTLTQGYGMTSFAKKGAYGGQPHNGIDIASGCGSPIQSIGAGTVLMSGYNNGYGNWVAIRHNNDLVSVYAHMQAQTLLGNGQEVTENTVIGFEGTTGYSTGCHVHLALYKNFFTYVRESNNQIYFNYFDGSINPLSYLP